MPPADEFANWLVTLEEHDLERIFLLSDFAKHTVGGIGKLKGAIPQGKYAAIVEEKTRSNIDLRESESLAPVLVCREIDSSPMSVIDGNHRMTAHLLRFGSIEGVFVFVCLHPKISSWRHLVPEARL